MDHRHVEIDRAVEQLLVRMAEENRSRGYDRIVGAFAGLRHEVSDYTVGNVLRPSRHTSCAEAQAHDDLADLHSGAFRKVGEDGFFSAEVLTPHGLVTYYLLFFIHLARRRVEIAGITTHPTRAVDAANANGLKRGKDAAPVETAAVSWMVAIRSRRRLLWESLSRAT